jgi:hypothetical protein
MTIFKFKNKNRCPSTMTGTSPGGIVLSEDACRLPVNHDGPHRGQNGTVWDNTGKRWENWEMYYDKPNRPKVFLSK